MQSNPGDDPDFISEEGPRRRAEEAAPLVAELTDALQGKAEWVVDPWPLAPLDH